MKQFFYLLTLLFVSTTAFSQDQWQWVKVASLPVATTSNSVCEAEVGNDTYVYSFGGISDSLAPTNIHKHIYKYKVSINHWSTITDIPDSLAKTGFRTSFVNNRIYLIGGKHINNDLSEDISNDVLVFNPFLDTFEVKGSALLTPTSDQVQCVWRDSIIFVISGLSPTGTTDAVQLYNPYFDSWLAATNIPDEVQYKSMGASGYILEDTIYYFGGTKNTSFQSSNTFRKGVINPDDPTDITWSIINPAPSKNNYKGACSGHNKTLFWIGGSIQGYNYIPPSDDTLSISSAKQIMSYKVSNNNYASHNVEESIMDLNSIAKLGGGNWMITGGIDTLGQISNQTFLLHNPTLSNIEDAFLPPYFQVTESDDYFTIISENIGFITVYDISGRVLFKSPKQLANLVLPKYSLQKGMLLFIYEDNINLPIVLKKVLTN